MLWKLHEDTEQLIRYLSFADDVAFVEHTERTLLRITTCFTVSAQLFSSEVILIKTEMLHKRALQKK